MMSNLRKRLSESAGFTLVELIVVIAVLGILAGIAVPRLTGVQDKAKLAEAETALGTLKNAMDMYYIENTTDSGINTDITSSHAITDYVDFKSLPNNWEFKVTETGEDSYVIKAKNKDDSLYFKFDKDTGKTTKVDSY